MIHIAQRLHPFSHIPGAICPLPKSNWGIQAFPTRLVFRHLITRQEIDLGIQCTGPMSDFTLQLDLEKGAVVLFGSAKEGYFRIFMTREMDGIALFFERAFSAGVTLVVGNQKQGCSIREKEKYLIPLPKEHPEISISQERLSLGMHKSQDWDMVARRADLKEIFPVWLRLGNCLPEQKVGGEKAGTLSLLSECKELLKERKIEEIFPAFQKLFWAGFSGIMFPRLTDTQFQGLVLSDAPVSETLSPLLLLQEAAVLIRALFYQERGDEIAFLPCLPPECHAGRFISIAANCRDEIHMEWSKKLLRRIIWRPATDRKVSLLLQKPIKRFRLRRSLKERGKIINQPHLIEMQKGQLYLLDNFET